MRTRETIQNDLYNDLTGTKDQDERSRAYLAQIHLTLLDIRDLLQPKEDNKDCPRWVRNKPCEHMHVAFTKDGQICNDCKQRWVGDKPLEGKTELPKEVTYPHLRTTEDAVELGNALIRYLLDRE